MSKSSKSNVSGKKKMKTSRSKAKTNGNAREVQENKELLTRNESNGSANKLADSRSSIVPGDQQDNANGSIKLNTSKENAVIIDSSSETTSVRKEIGESTHKSKENSKDINSQNENDYVCESAPENTSTVTNELSLNKHGCELFNSIYSGEIIPKFPNQSWSIHRTDIPERCIVISEMILRRESTADLAPLYIKQILFDEKLNYQLFLLNSRAEVKNRPHIVETIADMQQVISYADNLKLCVGGPEVSAFSNINPECAYRDLKARWRHNLCSLEVNEGDTCELCVSLEEILRRHVQRNKQSVKSRAFIGSAKRRRIAQS